MQSYKGIDRFSRNSVIQEQRARLEGQKKDTGLGSRCPRERERESGSGRAVPGGFSELARMRTRSLRVPGQLSLERYQHRSSCTGYINIMLSRFLVKRAPPTDPSENCCVCNPYGDWIPSMTELEMLNGEHCPGNRIKCYTFSNRSDRIYQRYFHAYVYIIK